MKFLASQPWVPAYAQIDLKNCVFKIKDGTTNNLTVTIGEGNFQWTEHKEREYTLDRGVLDEVRNGDQAPMDVSFEFTWEYIRSTSTGATPTVEDALKQINGAADWTSSDADTCRPYSVDLEITNTPTCATNDSEVYTFPDFRYEELSYDTRAGSVSCSGRCNALQPTVVRSTA